VLKTIKYTDGFRALLQVEMLKSARRCGAKMREARPSQNVQNKNTLRSEHFWKLRCSKSVRRCGAKHISKTKFTKHFSLGALLEVQMSKKCTLLRHEAHFEVGTLKAPHVRATFGG